MNPIFAILFLLPLCSGNVVDNVKVEPGAGADQVLNLVLVTIDQATKGLATTKLLEAAQQVQSLADSLTSEVSKEDVNTLIKEISQKIGAVSAVSEMLEDKLSYDARLLNDFLEIWSSLAKRGKELKAAELSTDVVIASISKISNAIQSVVGDIVDVVVYSQGNNSTTGSEIKPKDVVIQFEQNTEEQDAVKTKPIERRRVRIRCGWWARCTING